MTIRITAGTIDEKRREMRQLFIDLKDEQRRFGPTTLARIRRDLHTLNAELVRHGDFDLTVCPYCDGPKAIDDDSCRWEGCERQADEDARNRAKENN